jgi:isopentenyl-diphosphate delta-isomerase
MNRAAATEEQVILVDENDRETGAMEKMEAHRTGSLHRAFSLFLFDGSGRTLLQQRANAKYHSGGLWTNACCGHPRPGEGIVQAVIRRCGEELGATVQPLHQFSFRYRAHFLNGLQEHEVDHVLFAEAPDRFSPDPREVNALRWTAPEDLTLDLQEHPDRFTAWLHHCWPLVLQLHKRPVQRA